MKQHIGFNSQYFYYWLSKWADNELLLLNKLPSELRSHLHLSWHLYDSNALSDIQESLEYKICGDDNE